MTHLKFGLIVTLIYCLAFLNACAGSPTPDSNSPASPANSSTTNSVAASAKTNVEELALLINIPYESEDATWKEDAVRKKIIAVFKFSPAEATHVIADAEKVRPPEGVSVGSETWFPPELIAQSEMSGDDTLKGQAYAANAFFGGPYNDGRITRIDGTDYFVLELSAK